MLSELSNVAIELASHRPLFEILHLVRVLLRKRHFAKMAVLRDDFVNRLGEVGEGFNGGQGARDTSQISDVYGPRVGRVEAVGGHCISGWRESPSLRCWYLFRTWW